VEGYEHQEIAELLHCSVGNSKSQLHKAKLRIREELVRAQKQAGTTKRPLAPREAPVSKASEWEVPQLAPQIPSFTLAAEFQASGD
jgi:hypothetical protein